MCLKIIFVLQEGCNNIFINSLEIASVMCTSLDCSNKKKLLNLPMNETLLLSANWSWCSWRAMIFMTSYCATGKFDDKESGSCFLFCWIVYFSCPGVVIDSENCSSNSVNCTHGITLRPCCLGLYCQCQVISQSKCSFQRGHWHKDKVRRNIALGVAKVGFF